MIVDRQILFVWEQPERLHVIQGRWTKMYGENPGNQPKPWKENLRDLEVHGIRYTTMYIHESKKKSGEKICRNVREEIIRMKFTESKGNPIQLSEQRGLNYTHNFSSCLATNEL